MDTERSFVMIKPDGVKRGLVDEIIKRLEDAGLTIVVKKEMMATRDMVLEHYADSDTWYNSTGSNTIASYKKMGLNITDVFEKEDPIVVGKTIRQWLADYLTSDLVMPMIVEGPEGTIKKIRELIGKTNPIEADKGTIRGDFSTDSYEISNKESRPVHNLIHASESSEEAEREIAIWFPEFS